MQELQDSVQGDQASDQESGDKKHREGREVWGRIHWVVSSVGACLGEETSWGPCQLSPSWQGQALHQDHRTQV